MTKQEAFFRMALIEADMRPKDIRIDHARGRCYADDREYPIIFPKSIMQLIHWKKRDLKYAYIGNWTKHRDWVLNYASPVSHICFTPLGRMGSKWVFDFNYYDILCRSEFALCPDGTDANEKGEYRWTYRFLEAALCGAMPVVSSGIPGFTDGFHFASNMAAGLRDPLQAHYNQNLALKNHFL